ncbi:hypothetical protein ABW21_db0208367 [Orbilia brochopaga]|nr:hypothetical protein ABW21_db0208367 [Drechslerella brochopaga]
MVEAPTLKTFTDAILEHAAELERAIQDLKDLENARKDHLGEFQDFEETFSSLKLDISGSLVSESNKAPGHHPKTPEWETGLDDLLSKIRDMETAVSAKMDQLKTINDKAVQWKQCRVRLVTMLYHLRAARSEEDARTAELLYDDKCLGLEDEISEQKAGLPADLKKLHTWIGEVRDEIIGLQQYIRN